MLLFEGSIDSCRCPPHMGAACYQIAPSSCVLQAQYVICRHLGAEHGCEVCGCHMFLLWKWHAACRWPRAARSCAACWQCSSRARRRVRMPTGKRCSTSAGSLQRCGSRCRSWRQRSRRLRRSCVRCRCAGRTCARSREKPGQAASTHNAARGPVNCCQGQARLHCCQ